MHQIRAFSLLFCFCLILSCKELPPLNLPEEASPTPIPIESAKSTTDSSEYKGIVAGSALEGCWQQLDSSDTFTRYTRVSGTNYTWQAKSAEGGVTEVAQASVNGNKISVDRKGPIYVSLFTVSGDQMVLKPTTEGNTFAQGDTNVGVGDVVSNLKKLDAAACAF